MIETTIIAQDLREGDRVRITLEGDVSSIFSTGSVSVIAEGGSRAWPNTFTATILSNAKIIRLTPPIRVGDRVKDRDGDEGNVLAIAEHTAWVKLDKFRDPDTFSLSSLTRISEDR